MTIASYRAAITPSQRNAQRATIRSTRAAVDASVTRLLDPQHDSLPPSPQGDLTYGPMAPPDQRRDAYLRAASWWVDRMLQTPNPLVERMTYFWHNHFT